MTDGKFNLGERVMFWMRHGEVLTGTVVQVYPTRELYHVSVDGERYSIHESSIICLDPSAEIDLLRKQIDRLKKCLVASGMPEAMVEAIVEDRS